MSRSGRIIPACAVLGLLAAIVGAQPASRPAAEPEKLTVTVKEAQRRAQKLVVEDGKHTWVKLKVGEKLDEETIIRTGFSSRVVLQFADNSTVTIRSATKMGIAQFRKEGAVTKTRLGLKYGSMRARVEKARGPNDFTVSTPVATLAVTGTGLDTGFCGDIGGKSTCNFGGIKVYKGFQVRSLAGTESTNNQMSMPPQITQARSVAGIAVAYLTKNEKLTMMTHSSGLGLIIIGGNLGVVNIVKPKPPLGVPPVQIVDIPGLDIGIGD